MIAWLLGLDSGDGTRAPVCGAAVLFAVGAVAAFLDADGDRVPGPSEVTTFTDHHATDAFNRISERRYSEFSPSGDPIGGEQVNLKYDAAGNLIFDGEQLYVFDASNRLVETKQKGNLAVDSNGVLDGEPGDTVGEYTYDARGRLINRKVSNSGGLNTDGAGEFFYYDGARDIEHHKSNTSNELSLHRQYVYGLNYVDEVVAFNDSTDDDDGRAYLHRVLQDANYNVVAVTDSDGEVEQQYTYSPYGERLTAENVEVDPFTGDVTGVNPIDLATGQHTLLTQKGHQSLMHLPEIGGVQNRNRILAPPLGRFLQGDQNGTGLIVLSSLGFHGAAPMVSAAVDAELQYADGANIFNYLQNNPLINNDPTGLFTFADLFGTSAINAYLAAGATGGALGWMRSYATYSDKGSNWRLAGSFFAGARAGIFTATAMGFMSGALASALNVSLGTAIGSVGMMFSPLTLGLAINEYDDAETYGERLMAGIDIGLAGFGMFASHAAVFAGSGTVAQLKDVLLRATKAIGDRFTGSTRGIKIHSEAARLLKGLGRSDLRAEQGYRDGKWLGSVRGKAAKDGIIVDVVEGSDPQRPLAVYDHKTGSAELEASRINQIRSHLPKGYQNIPIKEIRVEGP